jgi:hypothetical protein
LPAPPANTSVLLPVVAAALTVSPSPPQFTVIVAPVTPAKLASVRVRELAAPVAS